MNELSLGVLFGALLFLIIASGFFSGSETGLMSLNRYRLRNLADKKHRGAMRAFKLLQTPDRLIGLILLGNNFVNILASAIATIIGLRLLGENGILIASILLTIVILVFAEVTPKTIAALQPERFALPASHIIAPLLKIFYPLVWTINLFSRGLFKLLGISEDARSHYDLNTEELRIVVNEAGTMIPHRHQQMLLSILDLEKVTVDDIMIPRADVTGIDIEDDWDDIVKQLKESQHTRLPVYADDIDHIIGIVHLRDVVRLFETGQSDKEELRKIIREAYFVPESTPLNTQLLNFQHKRQRIGLVVNEYGDMLGLVTLEDLLEEIVGEFTTDPSTTSKDISLAEDGTYIVDGSTSIRELNRVLQWNLPLDGPKTINGLVLEYLENIPDPGTSLLLEGYPIEIVQTSSSAIKSIRINPSWGQNSEPLGADSAEE